MTTFARLLLFTASASLFACTSTDDGVDAPSKEDARASVGKGDGSDFCEIYGWYGDGVCDDFCQNADPDCETAPTCTSDAQCGSDERCNAGEVCLSPCAPDAEVCVQVCAGFCVPDGGDPIACPAIYAPVCGADGMTYSNECHATAAGQPVVHQGACAPAGATCGGFANTPCSETEWCDQTDIPPGAMGDMVGQCKPRPEVCTANFTPVCGRDGNTYSNECVANGAGVDAKHAGSCAP